MTHAANVPNLQSANAENSARIMLSAKDMTAFEGSAGHSPRPDRGPNPEPNPEPDSALNPQRLDIPPADWLALFDAITDRLKACTSRSVCEQLRGKVPEHALEPAATLQETVQDCVDSMSLLHLAVPSEWHQSEWHQSQWQHSERSR